MGILSSIKMNFISYISEVQNNVNQRKKETRLKSLANRVRFEDIIYMNVPFLYIYQLTRSGGTFLLRSLDSHPQLLVIPGAVELMDIEEAGLEKFRRRLRKGYMEHNESGLHKWASNFEQRRIPIHFDVGWFDEIYRHYKDKGEYAAILTAFFNAWRNYQNLYGEKMYCVAHWGGNMLNIDAVSGFFSRHAPGSKMIFVSRDPMDWLHSSIRLVGYDKPQKSDRGAEELLSDYISCMKNALAVSAVVESNTSDIIIVNFEGMIRQPEETFRALCAELGLKWDPILLQTMFNRIHQTANSSHVDSMTPAADPRVIGKGESVRKLISDTLIIEEAREVYEEVNKLAVNRSL